MQVIQLSAAAGTLLAMSATGATASPAANGGSPCVAVVDAARRVPSEAWAEGLKALQPTLVIEKPWAALPTSGPPPDPLMSVIAKAPKVLDAIDFSDNRTIFVEHVPGANLYDAYLLDGTLECQSDVLLQARRGEAPSVIANPPSYKGGLCWTQSGDIGQVNGHAVFITHGPANLTTFDQDMQITPYENGQWGETCRISLIFQTIYKLTSHFCAYQSACKLGEKIAVDVATLFGNDESHNKIVKHFSFGPPPPGELIGEVDKLMRDKGPVTTPDFPTFGAKDGPDQPWSYADFQYFPLTLGDQSYVGAIGHEGVGWRESDVTLFAIYEPQGGRPRALASFVLERSVTGLKAASLKPAVVDGGP